MQGHSRIQKQSRRGVSKLTKRLISLLLHLDQKAYGLNAMVRTGLRSALTILSRPLLQYLTPGHSPHTRSQEAQRECLRSRYSPAPANYLNVILIKNNRVKPYGKKSHDIFKLMGWTYMTPLEAQQKFSHIGYRVRYIVKPFDNA